MSYGRADGTILPRAAEQKQGGRFAPPAAEIPIGPGS
jgi:hypothetical protein